MIYNFKIFNDSFLVQKYNKVLITNINEYYNFYFNLNSVSEGKTKSVVEINGMSINNKNSLFVDISTISSVINIIKNPDKLLDEYIKTKIENFEEKDEYENKINKILNRLFKDIDLHNCDEISIDLIKLIKSYANVNINDLEDVLKILNYVLEKSNLKIYIFIIDKKLLEKFNVLKLFEKIINKEKDILIFEISTEKTKFDLIDNLIIINKSINQVTFAELSNMVIQNISLYDKEKIEKYQKIFKDVLYYSLKRNEVDIMKKEMANIQIISDILEKELNLNTTDLQ